MALRNSDAVLRTLVERTIGEELEISMTRVAQASIPSGVRAYLRANLRDRFQEEISRYGPFARVQPLAPSTPHLHELFFAHAAEGYVYPREEFLADLENAAHFTENYICRPRWTLSSFLFHDATTISIATLSSRLEYVTEYVYLPQLLRRMVQQRQLREIESGVCSLLIRQIDSAVVREHSPRELALLARPIFDYFLFGAPQPALYVPLKPVLLFFKDKELNSIRDHIQNECESKGLTGISLKELTALCDDFVAVTPKSTLVSPPQEEKSPAPSNGSESPAPAQPDEEKDAASPNGAQEGVSTSEAQTTADAGNFVDANIAKAGISIGIEGVNEEVSNSPETVAANPKRRAVADLLTIISAASGQAIAGGVSGATTEQSSSETVSIEGPGEFSRDVNGGTASAQSSTGILIDAPAIQIATEEAGASTLQDTSPVVPHNGSGATVVVEPEARFETHPEPLPVKSAPVPQMPPPLPDLERMIRPEQRKRFIVVLCDRDADFYELIISRLNIMRTWNEASNYIRELFEINSVDPYRDEAITFTDIVQQRFSMEAEPHS